MNTLVIVLIAAVCLFGAYTLYGRWLANKWGIDPTAKTPAVVHEDGRDYVPTNGWTVFAHQFSSIAGAGPVTGAIQAAAFGWLPVLLWVLLGGIFMLTDYSTSPATEWGKDGINVNVVCPLAWTAKLEQFRDAYPDAFKANVKMPPMGHYGNAETEIGRVCVQLAMPDFKYMSGETLTLEGGMGQRP